MKQQGPYFVAESKNDFSGWEIMEIRPFKPGVSQVHIRHIPPEVSKETLAEFRLVYCKDEFLPTDFKKVVV